MEKVVVQLLLNWERELEKNMKTLNNHSEIN